MDMLPLNPTNEDIRLTAECLWKEARGEGNTGMWAVACVIRNRALKHHQSLKDTVMKKWAFSSMTDPHDPQFGKEPTHDAQYGQALIFADQLHDTTKEDITGGATLYHDDSIKCPWNPSKIRPTCKIGRLNFYFEL